VLLSACGSAPKADPSQSPAHTSDGLVLRDTVIYSQLDERWKSDPLGKTSDTMGSDGCLVHWAMIVKHDARGYHMRDPLRISKKPLIFPAGIKGYRAVRCIGLE